MHAGRKHTLVEAITGVITAILLLVPILFLLVLTHEYGHFLTARLFGVTVHEFGIGFPPKARTLFVSKKTGVAYTLNWLPIGGFVRMEGEDGESSDPNAFVHKPAWQRLIILAAGSFVNLVTAVLIFSFLALFNGTQVPQTQQAILYVQPDSPASAAGLKAGDLLVSANGKTVKTISDLSIEAQLNIGYKVPLVVRRDGQQQTINVVPRKPEKGQGSVGIESLDLFDSLKVDHLAGGSPSEKAGLRNGDLILAVDGKSVVKQPISDSLALNQALLGKTSASLTVLRGKEQAVISSVPITLPLRTNGSPSARAFLNDAVIAIPTERISYGVIGAVGEGFNRLGNTFGQMVATFKALFQGSQPVTNLSGPVGIGALTNQVAQNGGFIGLLSLMGFLGVNLFVVNMLPFPALDGGRFFFVLIELLLRPFGVRRIPPRLEGTIHFIGFAILMVFILVVSISDIGRLFNPQ